LPRPKFRFLVDEDLDIDIVHFLRSQDQDVAQVPKGIKNGAVYQLALKTRRLLLSRDKDFTDARLYPTSKTKGIAVVRVHPATPALVIPLLKVLLDSASPKRLKGKLILLEADGLHIL